MSTSDVSMRIHRRVLSSSYMNPRIVRPVALPYTGWLNAPRCQYTMSVQCVSYR